LKRCTTKGQAATTTSVIKEIMIENTKKRGTGFTEKTENLQEQRFPKLNWSRP